MKKCLKCGFESSDDSVFCSKCGAEFISDNENPSNEVTQEIKNQTPTIDNVQANNNQSLSNESNQGNNPKQNNQLVPIIVVGVVLVVCMFIINAFNSSKMNKLEEENNMLKQQLSVTEAPQQKNTDVSTKNSKFPNAAISYTTFSVAEYSDCLNNLSSTGVYRGGTDMDSGDYYILSPDGNAGYEVSSSPNNSTWDGNRIIRKIHIEEGQYIQLDYAILIPADRLKKDDWTKYGAFLVGKDLSAGEYKFEPMDNNTGTYQISNGEPDGDVIKASIVWEQEYVSLSDGQYIMINNAALTPVGN